MYRDYKKFDKNKFNHELKEHLSTLKVDEYSEFENTFLTILNKHAPIKKKALRANHVPYMTKALRKAIMRRSNLQTLYFNPILLGGGGKFTPTLKQAKITLKLHVLCTIPHRYVNQIYP